MDNVEKVFEEKMQKTMNVLKNELNAVRAGRANPALLDKVIVEYYGTPTPLKNLSNISVPEPRTLMVAPFDPAAIGDIEKAINASELGINPSNDGKVIRLTIPMLTEERRKELSKTVKKIGEDAKIAIRNIRRDAVDHFKKQEKANEITEDELKSSLDSVQKKVDKAVKDIDAIIEEKNKEVMAV